MPQSKDTGYQSGKKNKTHLYVAYKKRILVPKTPPDLKWGGGKEFTMLMDIRRKQEWQSLYQIN